MKKLNTVLAATALITFTTATQAALITVSGQLVSWDTTPVITTYENSLPAFSGTYDNATGALNLDFIANTAFVNVYGTFFGQTHSSAYNLSTIDGDDGSLVVNTDLRQNFIGDLLACQCNVHSDVLLDGAVSWDGSTGSFSTTMFTSGGQNIYAYSFTQAVPIPATAWLFGSSLLGLAGIKRKM